MSLPANALAICSWDAKQLQATLSAQFPGTEPVSELNPNGFFIYFEGSTASAHVWFPEDQQENDGFARAFVAVREDRWTEVLDLPDTDAMGKRLFRLPVWMANGYERTLQTEALESYLKTAQKRFQPMTLPELFGEEVEDGEDGESCRERGGGESKQAGGQGGDNMENLMAMMAATRSESKQARGQGGDNPTAMLHEEVSKLIPGVLPLLEDVSSGEPCDTFTIKLDEMDDRGCFLDVTVVEWSCYGAQHGEKKVKTQIRGNVGSRFPPVWGFDSRGAGQLQFFEMVEFVRYVNKVRYFYAELPSLVELFSEDVEDNKDDEDCAERGGGESKQASGQAGRTSDCQDVQEKVQPAYDAKTQQLLELLRSEPKMIMCRKELTMAMELTPANFMLASEELREDKYTCLCLCSRDYLESVDDRTSEEDMAKLFAHMRVELDADFVARAFHIFEANLDWRRMRTFLRVHDNDITAEVVDNLKKGVIYMPGKKMPNQFLCPIMRTPMRDPVVTADGHTYDRANIQEWFDRGNDTSPLTNKALENLSLLPNHALKSLMADMCETYTFEFPGREPSLAGPYSFVRYVYVYAATKTVRIEGDTFECCVSPQAAMKRERGIEYGGYLHRLKMDGDLVGQLKLRDCRYNGPVNQDRMRAGCQMLGVDGWVYMEDDTEIMALTTKTGVEGVTAAGVERIDKPYCSCVMLGHRKFRDAFALASFEGQDMDRWWKNSVFDSPFAAVSKFATE